MPQVRAVPNDLLPLPPLLAELHVHLLGTGNSAFWSDQLSRLDRATVLLARNLESGASSTGPAASAGVAVTAAALLAAPKTLHRQLVMPSRSGAPDFGGFAEFFVLRKSIARASPDALGELIAWNAARYASQGVRYIEFSVGARWVHGEHALALRRGIESALRLHGVHVRLLLGFDRTETSAAIRGEPFLSRLLDRMDEKLAPLYEPEHYAAHLRLLHQAKGQIEVAQLASYVVGFDYTGDERNAPYAPFLQPEFLAFVEAQQQRNHRFGIRLHAGEVAFPDSAAGYVSLRVTENLLEQCWRKNIPVRIGHAMGISLLDAALGTRWQGMYGAHLAERGRQACRETMRTATLEICLTSNRLLAGKPIHKNPMRALLQDGTFHCVLATDDPQIFGSDCSLAGEFEAAIASGLIRDRRQLDRLIRESIEGSFAPSALVAEIACNADCQPAAHDPPPDALSQVRRMLDLGRPHRALEQIWKLQERYRRSPLLRELLEEADRDQQQVMFQAP